jgi:hypothetical protein
MCERELSCAVHQAPSWSRQRLSYADSAALRASPITRSAPR